VLESVVEGATDTATGSVAQSSGTGVSRIHHTGVNMEAGATETTTMVQDQAVDVDLDGADDDGNHHGADESNLGGRPKG
jgi:hypothetical protein